jgi:hypothetical protein
MWVLLQLLDKTREIKMIKLSKFLIIFLMGLLVFDLSLEARGGGGRGGGGGRQMSRSSPNFSRTPSMSRAASNRSDFQRASSQFSSNRPLPSQQTRQFLQNSNVRNAASNRVNPQALSQRAQQLQSLNPQRQLNRQTANNLRNQLARNNPGYNRLFTDSFFNGRNYNPSYYRNGVNWWRGAAWSSLAGSLGWGWGAPLYYDESGNSQEVTPDDQSDSSNITTGYTDSNYPQTSTSYTPAQTSSEWIPLGVFAVGKTAAQAAYSNMFLQLAMNKQGEIKGTYFNSGTNAVYELEGSVDKDTQQAAWMKAENASANSPIMVTGLYNLTQDVVPVQIFFNQNNQQSWSLVRLSQ